MNTEAILSRMDSLNTTMQESAERGNLDSSVYVELHMMMGELIDSLRKYIME